VRGASNGSADNQVAIGVDGSGALRVVQNGLFTWPESSPTCY